MTEPGEAPRPVRVMIVDDNAPFRSVLRRLLDREHDVTVIAEAATGGQAIEYAGTLRPDIVLMDVSMPELDGITATLRLKENHPDLPVVLLSIGSKTQEIAAGLESGADDYLVKGASAATIVEAIRRHTGRAVPRPATDG